MQLVLFATTMVACLAAFSTVDGAQETRIPIGGFLQQSIENFRRDMACGVNGGPPLAPFELDFLQLDSDDPLMMYGGVLK